VHNPGILVSPWTHYHDQVLAFFFIPGLIVVAADPGSVRSTSREHFNLRCHGGIAAPVPADRHFRVLPPGKQDLTVDYRTSVNLRDGRAGFSQYGDLVIVDWPVMS
jgi:hypothetical protein